jgi:hypothetical protein
LTGGLVGAWYFESTKPVYDDIPTARKVCKEAIPSALSTLSYSQNYDLLQTLLVAHRMNQILLTVEMTRDLNDTMLLMWMEFVWLEWK